MKKFTLLIIALCLTAWSVQAQEVFQEEAVVQQQEESRWRFGVDAAFSYRTAKAADGINGALKDFVNKMRPGIGYGVDAHYFVGRRREYGIGARFFGRYASRSEIALKDKQHTFLVAPSVIYRSFSKNNKGAGIVGVSFGYLSYNEKITMDGYSESFSESGVGSSVDFGYDFRLNDKLWLGVKFSAVSGTVQIYGEDENTSSINLGVGLRF